MNLRHRARVMLHILTHGGQVGTTPFVTRCLEAFASLLEKPSSDRAMRQATKFDSVKLEQKGKLVILRYLGQPASYDADRFANRKLDVNVAQLRGTLDGEPIVVTVTLEQGLIMGLKVTRPVRLDAEFTLENGVLLRDPSLLTQTVPPSEIDALWIRENRLALQMDGVEPVQENSTPPLPDDLQNAPPELRDLYGSVLRFTGPFGAFDGLHGDCFDFAEDSVLALANTEDSRYLICLRKSEGYERQWLFNQVNEEFEPVDSLLAGLLKLRNLVESEE